MTIDTIKLAVCEAFEIHPAKIETGRKQKIAEARFALRVIVQKKTGMGGMRLSRVFKCDPASITHARNRFKEIHDIDPKFRRKVAQADYLISEIPTEQSMHQPIP